MSAEAQTAAAEPAKVSDKEFNFRQLEAKYAKELERERLARAELEQKVNELSQKQSQPEEESSDPYVDSKLLERKLNKFGQSTQADIQKAMETAKNAAKEELKREMWMDQNRDFFDVLQHADKFAQANPHLAETILSMPDTFERKKLVYENIKSMGLHKTQSKEPSIQEKIDLNRKHYYYQPSGIANAPFQPAGDFSESGQKDAYHKMQEAKKRLRLG
jgi:hypothetical protein